MAARAFLLCCVAGACGHALADTVPDLLFNCNLAGQKRATTLEGGRNILWDSGNAYAAIVTPQSIDATYQHQWSSDSTMRNRIVIDRQAGKLTMEVDELGTGGTVLNEMVRETGTCSRKRFTRVIFAGKAASISAMRPKCVQAASTLEARAPAP